MCPSVCLASGDVAVVWWVLSGFVVYVFVAAVLVMMLIERKARWPRLAAFVLMGGVVWYWCSMQKDPHFVVLALLLIVAPLLFLIRQKKR